MPAFHDSYAAARRAFRGAAATAGFELRTLDLGLEGPDGGDLSIDVVVKSGGPIRRAVVVSSGTHGVEGYFGNAVQLELLTGPLLAWEPAPGEAIVLVHAVNPWGMAHQRRVDQDGVDLNRNFRKPGEAFSGAPENYRRMDGLLNPTSPPSRLDPFPLTALPMLARHGFAALKEAVASGQYEFPRGLFYGGSKPSPAQQALAEALPALLGKADWVVHLDLHTGSGKWGTYVLALDLPAAPERVGDLKRIFGADAIQAFDPGGVLYTIHGALGPWLQAIMPEVRYDCLLAEFGTYANLVVLTGMRYENRIVQFAPDDPALRAKGRARMMELFCPADPAWRASCVAQAVAAFDQARSAVFTG